MGSAFILKSGGGGILSEDVTALRSQVLEGKTTITADSNDSIITGTMLSDANISAPNQLLENVIAYGRNGARYSGTALNDANISNSNQLLQGVIAYGRNGAKYSGNMQSMNGVTITPTTSQQIVSCANKKVLNDIIVQPIPSTYINIGGSGGSWTVFDSGAYADGWAFVPKYYDFNDKYNNVLVEYETLTDENGVSKYCVITRENGSETKLAAVLNRAIDLTNISKINVVWYTVWGGGRYSYYWCYIINLNRHIVHTFSKEEMSSESNKSHRYFMNYNFDVSAYSGQYFIGFGSSPYRTGIGAINLVR